MSILQAHSGGTPPPKPNSCLTVISFPEPYTLMIHTGLILYYIIFMYLCTVTCWVNSSGCLIGTKAIDIGSSRVNMQIKIALSVMSVKIISRMCWEHLLKYVCIYCFGHTYRQLCVAENLDSLYYSVNRVNISIENITVFPGYNLCLWNSTTA